MNALRSLMTVVILLASGIVLAGPARTQDTLEALQRQFDRETNTVRKAKLLQKLGDVQFQEAHREESAGNHEGAAKIYVSFRDNVRAALHALKSAHPDAERHSDGYRQLHIELRKGLRDLEETIVSAPEQERPRFERTHKELIATEDDLVKLLFPRRKAGSEKPAGSPPEEPKSKKQTGRLQRPRTSVGGRT